MKSQIEKDKKIIQVIKEAHKQNYEEIKKIKKENQKCIQVLAMLNVINICLTKYIYGNEILFQEIKRAYMSEEMAIS